MQNILNGLTGVISSLGLPAIFLLMFAESSLIPIPSEVTMSFAGFLAGRGYFSLFAAILVGSIASIMGAMLIYMIVYKKGEDWVKKIVAKYGKYIFMREEEYEKSKTWFNKHNQWLVFVARLLPVVRMFIALPAGVTRMNTYLYFSLVSVAALIWSATFSFIGFKLGENWTAVEPIFKKFQFLIIILGVGAIAFYIYHHLKRRKH